MNSRLTLGVAIPQTFPDGRVDPRGIRDFLQRAETLGFHSAWVVEHMFGTIPALAPVELPHVRGGGDRALATGRRGVAHRVAHAGADGQEPGDARSVERRPAHRRRRSRWQPQDLPRVRVDGESARRALRRGAAPDEAAVDRARRDADGEFYRLENASVQPRPLQTPHPPLWFGGHHPLALRRAVELGDGFIGAGSASTATFAEQMKVLRAILAERGRDASSFPIGKRVYLAIDRDRARAGKRLAEWFGAFYGRPALAEEVSVWGDVDTCVEGLARGRGSRRRVPDAQPGVRRGGAARAHRRRSGAAALTASARSCAFW